MPHFKTTNQTISVIILFGLSINPLFRFCFLFLFVCFAVNDKMASSKMCTGSENYQLQLDDHCRIWGSFFCIQRGDNHTQWSNTKTVQWLANNYNLTAISFPSLHTSFLYYGTCWMNFMIKLLKIQFEKKKNTHVYTSELHE